MSEEQNKAPSEGEARVLSDDELKGIVGGGKALVGGAGFVDRAGIGFAAEEGFGGTAKRRGAQFAEFQVSCE